MGFVVLIEVPIGDNFGDPGLPFLCFENVSRFHACNEWIASFEVNELF